MRFPISLPAVLTISENDFAAFFVQNPVKRKTTAKSRKIMAFKSRLDASALWPKLTMLANPVAPPIVIRRSPIHFIRLAKSPIVWFSASLNSYFGVSIFLFSLLLHRENDLAEVIPPFKIALGGSRFREREGAVDHHLELFLPDQIQEKI